MEKKALEKGSKLLLAHRLLYGHLDNKQCIDWSLGLMEKGCVSDNLSILAGLDYTDSYRVEYYFGKLIFELGLDTEPNDEELFQTYVLDVARQVVDKQMSPLEGLSILQDIYSRSYEYNFSTALISQFYNLSEDISLLGEYAIYYSDLTDENKCEAIVNEMKLLLLECDLHFHRGDAHIYCPRCKQLVYRSFDRNRWFARSKQCVCGKCHSKEVLRWDYISDQASILDFLQKNPTSEHQ